MHEKAAKTIVIGMGCRKGKSAEELCAFAQAILREEGLAEYPVRSLVSSDIKREEQGLIGAAAYFQAEFVTFPECVLAAQPGEFSASDFVRQTVGVDNVCERAVMAYGCSELLVKKRSGDGMTFAAGVLSGRDEKKLYVVGIGPGDIEDMTLRAYRALAGSSVIAGYTVYCDLVRQYFPEKEFIETPMMGEEKRVQLAFEVAEAGKKTALICSGDAGVYGLAGLVAERSADFPEVEVTVIPGVTAALSGGAMLGAPLIHDFCLISLSDRMTPWELIERRLHLAAEADLVIVLYNPESRKRAGYLKKACDILLPVTGPDRICGIARQIGRNGEESRILTLGELRDAGADMFSTVFIGNSQTKRNSGYMITPRGYRSEKEDTAVRGDH